MAVLPIDRMSIHRDQLEAENPPRTSKKQSGIRQRGDSEGCPRVDRNGNVVTERQEGKRLFSPMRSSDIRSDNGQLAQFQSKANPPLAEVR